MTSDEIRAECDQIAAKWPKSSFDAREKFIDRLELFAAELKNSGSQWMLRRDVHVLHKRLTISLSRIPK